MPLKHTMIVVLSPTAVMLAHPTLWCTTQAYAAGFLGAAGHARGGTDDNAVSCVGTQA